MYDTAQICQNGHIITDALSLLPEKASNFCEECGAPTISQCPNCKKDIRGYLKGSLTTSTTPTPWFCPSCGAAYPWTSKSVEAYRELIGLASNLSDEERNRLASDIDDLIMTTP